MLVYGYKRDLKTVPVELSVSRVVKAGIDPWRLDLFDPDPIALRVDGKRLFFRRLTNLSFAYREKQGGPVIVGLHDGTGGVCFYGRQEEATLHAVKLSVHLLSNGDKQTRFCRARSLEAKRRKVQRFPLLKLGEKQAALIWGTA